MLTNAAPSILPNPEASRSFAVAAQRQSHSKANDAQSYHHGGLSQALTSSSGSKPGYHEQLINYRIKIVLPTKKKGWLTITNDDSTLSLQVLPVCHYTAMESQNNRLAITSPWITIFQGLLQNSRKFRAILGIWWSISPITVHTSACHQPQLLPPGWRDRGFPTQLNAPPVIQLWTWMVTFTRVQYPSEIWNTVVIQDSCECISDIQHLQDINWQLHDKRRTIHLWC